MLHTKFPAFKPSGSKEEGFRIFFYVFLSFEPRTPWCRAILDPGTFIRIKLVKDHQAMLHTKFQASKPNGSEEEDFSIFSVYF